MTNERERLGEWDFVFCMIWNVLCDVVTSAGDVWLFVDAHRSVDDIDWATHYVQKVSMENKNGKLAKITMWRE